MAIEITGKINSPIQVKTPPKTGGEDAKQVTVENTVKGDSVALTTTQEIKKAFSSSSALPVDVDRVNSIKKALADGSYSINAEKVAKKLIQFEELLSRDDNDQQ